MRAWRRTLPSLQFFKAGEGTAVRDLPITKCPGVGDSRYAGRMLSIAPPCENSIEVASYEKQLFPITRLDVKLCSVNNGFKNTPEVRGVTGRETNFYTFLISQVQ